MSETSQALSTDDQSSVLKTGIAGLDEVLSGGLTRGRMYLIEGAPGAGKTTLGLQFLLEGAKAGECVLYVCLSESPDELREVAASHGWDFEAINVLHVQLGGASLREESSTVFHPAEAELTETTNRLLEEVNRHKPSRIVFDSLGEMRMMAQNPLRYRRLLLALKNFFVAAKCTVLLLDSTGSQEVDLQLQMLAHGVIFLEKIPREYGVERRRLRVVKMRGKDVALGWHDYVVRRGGIQLFPRLNPIQSSNSELSYSSTRLSSGIKELDEMVGGGMSVGTSTLIVGPAGAGKSTLSHLYVTSHAHCGGKAVIFSFDESIETALRRSSGLGIPLGRHIQDGSVLFQTINPGRLSPGELAWQIRWFVEEKGITFLVLDSLNGYLNAMPDERFLVIQLHEILSYLESRHVTSIIILSQHGTMGSTADTPIDTTYFADNAFVLRFFEASGRIRKAISVVKMRSGFHESTIRELSIIPGSVRVGEPLTQFQGVLTGEPTFFGNEASLMEPR